MKKVSEKHITYSRPANGGKTTLKTYFRHFLLMAGNYASCLMQGILKLMWVDTTLKFDLEGHFQVKRSLSIFFGLHQIRAQYSFATNGHGIMCDTTFPYNFDARNSFLVLFV